MSADAANDTIVAIASAPGRGGVGVVRLSGSAAFTIAARIAGALPPPREARLRELRDAQGQVLDRGLVLAFPGPASFTGEDVVELQAHGAPVVLDLLVRAAIAHGARSARPGEFSERAFLNGRMDLAQAEAVADLIAASTGAAARAARRSLEGELSRRVNALAEELLQLRTYVEGALDFSDEDVDWLADDALRARLESVHESLQALLRESAQGRRLQEGLTVALAGRPNAGKSTLLNALAGSDAAIVTDVPGTTRDVLREAVAVDGLPVTLVDTAGLRTSSDPVERIGIERAWQALERAELVLFLVDDREGVTPADRELLERLPCGPEVVTLRNKCDLTRTPPARVEAEGRVELRIGARDGLGLDLLRAEILRVAGLAGSESLFSARTRHVEALSRALAFVRDARQRILEGATPELAAEELRLAQQSVGEITGQVSSDDLLGRIFSQFCIGK
ncbi:MAG TPA: tRNA uridine-5-carboxymethylaminomethyl(34) synthesis GTPase MnmE [Candidatus Binatia bacterium]|nr:tRNA uridine-5-carboxymethylaminomethyl(34) synthesis GTPase MnmE [Candidatus Binatia bacterium]